MAIRQRGASWQADVKIAGKRTRQDFKTEAEARAWVAHHTAPKEEQANTAKPSSSPNGPDTGTKMKTFGQACDRAFARYYKGSKWEDATWKLMGRVRAELGEDMPLRAFQDNGEALLDSYVEQLREENKASSTINQRLAIVSKVLRFAVLRKAIERMPKIERERLPVGRVRWINGAEEAELLRLFELWGMAEHAEVTKVLLDTGMRHSELWALTSRDVRVEDAVDPKTGQPNGLKTGPVSIWKTKTDNPRTIYMTDRVALIVEARVKAAAPGEALFPYTNSWFRVGWERARAHMKLSHDKQFIPYICRHTCASRMVQRGVQLPVVKEWLGHKGLQMTMRYAHLAPSNFQAAAEAIARGAAD